MRLLKKKEEKRKKTEKKKKEHNKTDDSFNRWNRTGIAIVISQFANHYTTEHYCIGSAVQYRSESEIYQYKLHMYERLSLSCRFV